VGVEARSERRTTSDFFSFLGLPRKLGIDAADLEQRYRALSRQYHPDYFYNAPPAERRASLERSSYLNDAYRTLRNSASRIEYLLKVEGADGGNGKEPAGSSQAAPPPGLLEEVFALNEELDEIRALRASGAPVEQWKPRLERAREPIEAKRAEHEAALEELARAWDAVVDARGSDADRRSILQDLRSRFLERNYINNLLADIEGEISS
jgi:molecular chaperone HscB